jgi:hypothetical protein
MDMGVKTSYKDVMDKRTDTSVAIVRVLVKIELHACYDPRVVQQKSM